MPGSHFGPFGLPGQTAHVPEAPHAAGSVPLTHAPDEQQNPPLQLPSPVAPQALVHEPPAHVGVPAPQTAQAWPFEPHAMLFCEPTTHVPALQHPLLHGWVASHELEQRCVAPLHDASAGQSAAPLQPQVVPFSHR